MRYGLHPLRSPHLSPPPPVPVSMVTTALGDIHRNFSPHVTQSMVTTSQGDSATAALPPARDRCGNVPSFEGLTTVGLLIVRPGLHSNYY